MDPARFGRHPACFHPHASARTVGDGIGVHADGFRAASSSSEIAVGICLNFQHAAPRGARRVPWPAGQGIMVMPPEEASLSDDAKWSSATLRVWSEAMSPEAIADALGLEPTEVHRKGEPVSK